MTKFVKAILKWAMVIWGGFMTLSTAYIVVGRKLGFIEVRKCTCGGTRFTSHGKVYGWLYK